MDIGNFHMRLVLPKLQDGLSHTSFVARQNILSSRWPVPYLESGVEFEGHTAVGAGLSTLEMEAQPD